MDVTIIIVNYNTKKLTLECLESVYSNTSGISFEIIVVDNASVDGSIQAVEERFPDVRIYKSDINLGFGRANNLGLQHAIGKYIFLLNSDTVLVNNAILEFYSFCERNSSLKIGALGCLLRNNSLNIIHSHYTFPSISDFLKRVFRSYLYVLGLSKNVIHERSFEKGELYFDVEYITGADLFIPREIIKQIGFFDPIFFMYFEETDYQKRMADLNFRRFIISGPEIIHLEGGSSNTSNNKRRIMTHRSLFLYLRKHFSFFYIIAYKFLYVILNFPFLFNFRYTLRENICLFKIIFAS